MNKKHLNKMEKPHENKKTGVRVLKNPLEQDFLEEKEVLLTSEEKKLIGISDKEWKKRDQEFLEKIETYDVFTIHKTCSNDFYAISENNWKTGLFPTIEKLKETLNYIKIKERDKK